MQLIITVWITLNIISAITTELEAPELFKITALEPPGFYIIWTSVTYKQSDPILGYKIRLWEIPEDSQGLLTLINADEMPGLIVHKKPLQGFNTKNVPNNKMREVVIPGASTTKAVVKNIKTNVFYDIRVLAYKKDEEGLMSLPQRVKIVKGENGYYAFIQRTSNLECIITIPSNTTLEGENYLHLEINYI